MRPTIDTSLLATLESIVGAGFVQQTEEGYTLQVVYCELCDVLYALAPMQRHGASVQIDTNDPDGSGTYDITVIR